MGTTATENKKPAANSEVKKPAAGNKDRPWYPRVWDGMPMGSWFPMLWRNRFAINPLRVPMGVIVSLITPTNTVLGALQSTLYGRKIAAAEIQEPPIFIIGHWRSGTTMLHEYLVLDKRFAYPNTYQCYAPTHFLVSYDIFGPWLKYLLPKHRPMDNMAFGWERPQEDEFALAAMGVPSPYLTLAFPNRPPQHQEYIDFEGVSPADRQRWKEAIQWFIKAVSLRSPGRMVLKSPPHTGRIGVLREAFPDAKFLHIVRDPYTVFASTINLWKRLYADEGLQIPRLEGLDEYVFETFNQMYRAFDRDRPAIPPGNYSEVRYEDLVKTPVEQMRRIYDELGLGRFDQMQPALEAYVASQKDYKTNRWQFSAEVKREVGRRWAAFFDRYGYTRDDG